VRKSRKRLAIAAGVLTLRIGIAFHRYRVREGRAPETMDGIMPPGVSPVLPAGSWCIEPHPDTKERCFRFRYGDEVGNTNTVWIR
jgi:hypothetical protein